MNPFNVRIESHHQQVTLTILPTDQAYFKVVYYGRILGAIHYDKESDRWNLLDPEEVVSGDLPPFTGILDQEMLEIELDYETIVKIGNEILKSQAF